MYTVGPPFEGQDDRDVGANKLVKRRKNKEGGKEVNNRK